MNERLINLGLPYRGIIRRGKVTKFRVGDDNFPPTKLNHDEIKPRRIFFSDEISPAKTTSKLQIEFRKPREPLQNPVNNPY